MPLDIGTVYLDRETINAAREGLRRELSSLFRHTLPKQVARYVSRQVRRAEERGGELPSYVADQALRNMRLPGWESLVPKAKALLSTASREAAGTTLYALGVARRDLSRQSQHFASEWASHRAAEMIGMRRSWDGKLEPNPNAEMAITDTTRDMVRSLVHTATKQEWGADRLEAELNKIYAFSPERAELIAKTEIGMAGNRGKFIAFRTSGIVHGKRWRTKGDSRVEEDCRTNEAIGVIGLDDKFPSGHAHPTAHPRCRCQLAAVLE